MARTSFHKTLTIVFAEAETMRKQGNCRSTFLVWWKDNDKRTIHLKGAREGTSEQDGLLLDLGRESWTLSSRFGHEQSRWEDCVIPASGCSATFRQSSHTCKEVTPLLSGAIANRTANVWRKMKNGRQIARGTHTSHTCSVISGTTKISHILEAIGKKVRRDVLGRERGREGTGKFPRSTNAANARGRQKQKLSVSGRDRLA